MATTGYATFTDAALFQRLQAGDAAAFTEIYHRYWDLLFTQAMRLLKDADEAQDLVQELFTTLWLKASSIPSGSNLSGYLYVSLRHKVLNVIRHQKVQQHYLSDLSKFVEAHKDQTLETLYNKELQQIIATEINQLPEKMKAVFLLSREADLSHKEIADQLDISHQTVKKQVTNALRILRLKLNALPLLLLLFVR